LTQAGHCKISVNLLEQGIVEAGLSQSFAVGCCIGKVGGKYQENVIS